MTHAYDDIINLPHPTSPNHPRMPISDRAAIFSPFAALTGHGAAIDEAARLTERKIEPGEDAKEVLDMKQRLLEEADEGEPEVSVTWFKPDEKKRGGSYVTTVGRFKRTDALARVMLLTDGTAIPLDDITDIESGCFSDIFEQ